MNKEYRFIGSGESVVGSLKMNRFGQKFAMPESLAKDCQAGGAAILEEADFKTFGFTDDELKIWADPFMDPFDVPAKPEDAKAKEDFQRKRLKAQELFVQVRQGLLEPKAEKPTPGAPSPKNEEKEN